MSRPLRLAGMVALCAVLASAVSAGEVALELTPVEAPPSWQAQQRYELFAIEDGHTGLIGRIEGEDFLVTDIRQIALVTPDGSQLDLRIEEGSLLEEFGEIVALRFFVAVPEGVDGPFTLVWGPDIDADNTMTPRLLAAPGKLDRYRFAAPVVAADDEVSLATLRIVADSQADWYFLWYLVPLVAILVLVILQTIHGLRSDR
jgi:hypothetical protein